MMSNPVPTNANLSDSLKQSLARHHNLLNDHLQIWRSVLVETQPGSEAHSVTLQCIENTQCMITSCFDFSQAMLKQQAHEGASQNQKRSPPEVASEHENKPKRRKQDNESVLIASTDQSPQFRESGETKTNLGDAKSSLQGDERDTETLARSKRRHSQVNRSPRSLDINAGVQAEPYHKRLKTDHSRYTEDVPEGQPEDDEAHYEAFEAKVQLRLKQKEDLRRQKANKKRKRGSAETSNGREKSHSENDLVLPRTSKQPRIELSSLPGDVEHFDTVSTPQKSNGAEPKSTNENAPVTRL